MKIPSSVVLFADVQNTGETGFRASTGKHNNILVGMPPDKRFVITGPEVQLQGTSSLEGSLVFELNMVKAGQVTVRPLL